VKDIFANNSGKNMMLHNNFSLLDTSSLPASIIKYSFYKEKWGALHVVNFMDADALDLAKSDIRQALYNELSIFVSGSTGPIIYFKVFVTEMGMDDDISSCILSLFRHSAVEKASLIPVIVDLSIGRVLTGPGMSMDQIGLLETLESSIDEAKLFSKLYDLEEIEKNKEKSKIRIPEDRKIPVVTYTIMSINIIVFVLMLKLSRWPEWSIREDIIIDFGAKVNSLISGGQYWRLLSCAFLHLDYGHIAFNMLSLYSMGPMIERIYGRWRYILIYLISALAGSIASFIFSTSVSAGASGAVFGLLGAIVHLGWKKPSFLKSGLGVNILLLLALNIVLGFTYRGIDNFAHAGGFLGGIIASALSRVKV
jgi:membrane associated rhomboid family serine protease